LEKTRAALGPSSTEAEELPQLVEGEGLWRIKDRAFVVRHICTPDELKLFDTNAHMLANYEMRSLMGCASWFAQWCDEGRAGVPAPVRPHRGEETVDASQTHESAMTRGYPDRESPPGRFSNNFDLGPCDPH
jgi:hypothetical protein